MIKEADKLYYLIGELLIKISKQVPHSDKWYSAFNEYDKAAALYNKEVGNNCIDWHNRKAEEMRMRPNYKGVW